MSYAIEMLGITKRFGTLVANDHIDFQVETGEIHALLGENGAGKSTLMSILFGLYQPDEGHIRVRGNEVVITDPNVANELRIGMVHQHFKLVDVFTVTQNIILGQEPTKGGIFVDIKAARNRVDELSKQYHFDVSPDALIRDISVGMQQRVEILKMLYRDADILIFDEPTAVLTPQEIEGLMKIIKDFAKHGKTIVLISHKLDEIMAVADRCTVLRKGKMIGTVDIKDTSIEKLAEMMVGRKVVFTTEKTPAQPGAELMAVHHMSVIEPSTKKRVVDDVSFNVRKGEIVCIAGVEGNGQSQLVKAIAGLLPFESGILKILGQDLTEKSIRDRWEGGLGHIPEDRQKYGLVLDYTLAENMVLNQYYYPQFSKNGMLLDQAAIRSYAEAKVAKFDVRSSNGIEATARSMSGGNQQKAILAREISRDPSVLIAVQPTRGLDVGAIEFIHKNLIAHRDAGHSVLLVSLELDEVMNISDRILVMYAGRIVADLVTSDTSVEELGLYMLGAKKGGVAHE